MYLTRKYQAQQVQALLWIKHAFWNKNKNINNQKPENKQPNTQIILQNSMIFPWFFSFFQIPWFFHAWNFFCDFPGFPVLVGTLLFKHIQNLIREKLSKFSQLSFCQKLFFLNQTPSCICSMCLHCIGKVSNCTIKSCGRSWSHTLI